MRMSCGSLEGPCELESGEMVEKELADRAGGSDLYSPRQPGDSQIVSWLFDCHGSIVSRLFDCSMWGQDDCSDYLCYFTAATWLAACHSLTVIDT